MGRSCSSAEEQHMSTLITEDSSPVSVVKVFADFRHGRPDSGIVYVGARRHKIQVCRTTGGLVGTCACPGGCAAIPDAIRAVEIMGDAWERGARTGAEDSCEFGGRENPIAGPRESEHRPYDGLARATCEADLLAMDMPSWAYNEQGIRRPILEAEIAQELWYELHRAIDPLLGKHRCPRPAHRFPVIRYYRASWEPDRGMTDAAFEIDVGT
jgi:hypothetical protein